MRKREVSEKKEIFLKGFFCRVFSRERGGSLQGLRGVFFGAQNQLGEPAIYSQSPRRNYTSAPCSSKDLILSFIVLILSVWPPVKNVRSSFVKNKMNNWSTHCFKTFENVREICPQNLWWKKIKIEFLGVKMLEIIV